jgi:hypothetical protein
MLAGHIGAALAIGRAERRVNLGVFVAAALALDIVLWVLVLLGAESVSIPATFASTHQAEYTFPYSHGLLASLVWSVLAGAVAVIALRRLQRGRLRAAAMVGAAVFSHWLLDALVHAPELPLTGVSSTKIGFGLWHTMTLALVVEAGILLAGLWIFLPGSHLSRGKAAALAVLCVLVLGFTVVGMTVAPAPPSAQAMAASSLILLVIVCALAYWLGRPSDEPRA